MVVQVTDREGANMATRTLKIRLSEAMYARLGRAARGVGMDEGQAATLFVESGTEAAEAGISKAMRRNDPDTPSDSLN